VVCGPTVFGVPPDIFIGTRKTNVRNSQNEERKCEEHFPDPFWRVPQNFIILISIDIDKKLIVIVR
jgi:hypothetical protein